MSDRPRIDKVTTSSGDKGLTSLADGERYLKSNVRIELVGSLDELNCTLGLIHQFVNEEVKPQLIQIQSRLFDLGAAVATGQPQPYWSQQTQQLEEWVTLINSKLEPLKEFVLPGGSEANARTHLARAVCRRTERVFWLLNDEKLVDSGIPAYLNRLSDYLFVLARSLSENEVLWEQLIGDPDNED